MAQKQEELDGFKLAQKMVQSAHLCDRGEFHNQLSHYRFSKKQIAC
jgi:hypothetical protein